MGYHHQPPGHTFFSQVCSMLYTRNEGRREKKLNGFYEYYLVFFCSKTASVLGLESFSNSASVDTCYALQSYFVLTKPDFAVNSCVDVGYT